MCGPQIAMPMFESIAALSPDNVLMAWAHLWPGCSPLELRGGEKGVAEYACDGSSVMVAIMEAPIPHADIAAACEVSWMWPGAAAITQKQCAHAIVAVVGDRSAVESAALATRMTAALTHAGAAVGVYWGSGGMVHMPALFVDMARSILSDDGLPVPLWIGVRVSDGAAPGSFTMTTRGFSAFGHRELEVIDSRMSVGDLRILAYDFAGYALENGPVLKDGSTFGRSEEERFRVEHTNSRFRRREPVVRLHA